MFFANKNLSDTGVWFETQQLNSDVVIFKGCVIWHELTFSYSAYPFSSAGFHSGQA